MMKRLLFTLSFLAMTVGMIAQQSYRSSYQSDDNGYQGDQQNRSKIQLALILDTSGSMDDLIDQARGQMWSMVHEIMYSDNGEQPILEIALYEYGSSSLSRRDDFIALHVPFTTDLDWIADELFTLRTSGRAEYHGAAVARAADELNWSNDPRDLKLIFIAGNEDFDQGPVDFRQAMAIAASRDINVNTIFCGDYTRGQRLGWEEGAYFGGGDYMAIGNYQRDRNNDPRFQSQLMSLNRSYNATYIPYGAYGATRYQRLNRVDNYAYGYGQTVIINRTLVKVSPGYSCADWDLVDAYRYGLIDLRTIRTSDLPPNMRRMSFSQRQAYLVRMQNDRDRLRGEIRTVAEPRRPMAPPRGSTGPSTAQGSRPAAGRNATPGRASSPRNLDQAVSQSVRQHQVRRAEGRQVTRPTAPVSSIRQTTSTSGRNATVRSTPQPAARQTETRRPSSSRPQTATSSQTRTPQRQSTAATNPTPAPRATTQSRQSTRVEQSRTSGRTSSTQARTSGTSRSSVSSGNRSSASQTQPRSSSSARSSSQPSTSSRSTQARTSTSSPRSTATRTQTAQPQRTESTTSSRPARSASGTATSTRSSSTTSETSSGSSESGTPRRASSSSSSRRP